MRQCLIIESIMEICISINPVATSLRSLENSEMLRHGYKKATKMEPKGAATTAHFLRHIGAYATTDKSYEKIADGV